jgi:hypothetical protein
METIIVICSISAITYWGYNIAKLLDSRDD